MSREERHEQLLDVTEELFVARGYAAVSMEDIARGAGITRPIVYAHFESKEGAYIACVARARKTYEAKLRERVDPRATPIEQLRAGAASLFEVLEENPGRWRLLFGSNAVLPGVFDERLADLRFETIEQIRHLLAAAAPAAPPLRIEAIAHAISGIGERLGHWWLTRPDITRQEMTDHYVEIVWPTIAPIISAGVEE
jgi:AcrR family transcriptional regulator